MAESSRAARLAGQRVCPHRLGHQTDAQVDRHIGHLPAIVAGHAGTLAKRPGEPAPGTRPADSSLRRSRPRSGPRCERTPRGAVWRAVREAVPAAGAMEGAFRHGLSAGPRPESLSPQLVYFLETDDSAAVDDELRLGRP